MITFNSLFIEGIKKMVYTLLLWVILYFNMSLNRDCSQTLVVFPHMVFIVDSCIDNNLLRGSRSPISLKERQLKA